MSYLDKIDLPVYSRKEDWINAISHMVGGGLAILGLLLCLMRAIVAWRWDYALLGFLYGITMIAMHACSAVYHALAPSRGKKAMRMVDHAMVHPMIAGTITPFAVLVIAPVHPTLSWVLVAAAWVTAAGAAPVTLALFHKTKILQTALYLVQGVLCIVAVVAMWPYFDRTGMWLLLGGGIVYAVGALPAAIGSKKPYMRSVFHLFVLAGSILQFLSLYLYVFVK